MTSGWVKRHIHKLQNGDIFTAREVLHYGPKASVYKALQRCVAIGSITRLAQGVYMRSYWGSSHVPLPMEIAQAKAQALGRLTADIPKTLLPPEYPVAAISQRICWRKEYFPAQIALNTSGRTTAFRYKDCRIILKGSRGLDAEQKRLAAQLKYASNSASNRAKSLRNAQPQSTRNELQDVRTIR